MFTESDKKQMAAKGIDPAAAAAQVERFRAGFPYVALDRPATPGDGITQVADDDAQRLIERHAQMLRRRSALKFVPASGAATRMFKKLFETLALYDASPDSYLQSLVDRSFDSVYFFCEHLEKFAFYADLAEAARQAGDNLGARLAKKDYAYALRLLLSAQGLDYGQTPKGLIKFHRYGDHSRTAAEEHLVEAADYAAAGGAARLHFTVSPEHLEAFRRLMADVVPGYEERLGVRFQIDFSTQDPATDTLAVDMGNQPFRGADGGLLFRPAGHGALLENLNRVDAERVFIKNIDNVAAEGRKADTVRHKMILSGLLDELVEQAHTHLLWLESPDAPGADQLAAMLDFCAEKLNAPHPFGPADLATDAGRAAAAQWLRGTLDRPTRVCGMVRNEGEPGGGPFWVRGDDGRLSLQIVESSQIDPADDAQRALLAAATHFNPVDLVCNLADHHGRKYDLRRYRDDNTGFISVKSSNGKDLKAMELPGLWNGAMARWNTVFVEVPATTFNPVKTVNDLLRKEHLAAKDLMEGM